MPRFLCLALLGVVSPVPIATAFAAEPIEVIKKAIDANGGKDKLSKYNAMSFSGGGEVNAGDMKLEYTGTWYFAYPDKMRFDLESTVGGNTFKGSFVVNGKEGWQKFGDMAVSKMNADQLKAFQVQIAVGEASSLVPLLDGKRYRLSSVGEVDVNGTKTIGINVTNKSGLDVNFYFDPKTWLIVKEEYQTKTETGKDVAQSVYRSKYKKVDGVMMPMAIVIHHDGKQAVTAKIDSVQFDEKVNADLFKKPK